MEAHKHQTVCVQHFVKFLATMKQANCNNWFLPMMYELCLDLRLLALKCEETDASTTSNTGEILQKSADSLMGCFRICANDNR